MPPRLFLDTAYAIALSSDSDRFHPRAVELSEWIEAAGATLVTTRAVLLEIGNALARQPYRQAAIQLLDSLEADRRVTIVPLSETLYARAARLFRERPDKE